MSASDRLAFMAHLQQAGDFAQAGFYFEEGGCFGMALALYEKCTELGLSPAIIVSPEPFCHALIEIEGQLYDWQGTARLSVGAQREVHTPASLATRVTDFQHTPEDLESDCASAMDIINSACELAQHALPEPPNLPKPCST